MSLGEWAVAWVCRLGIFETFFPGSISEIQQFRNSFQGIFCTICAVSKFSKVLVEWKETIENGERENNTSISIDANYCLKTIPRGRQVKPGDRIAVYELI